MAHAVCMAAPAAMGGVRGVSGVRRGLVCCHHMPAWTRGHAPRGPSQNTIAAMPACSRTGSCAPSSAQFLAHIAATTHSKACDTRCARTIAHADELVEVGVGVGDHGHHPSVAAVGDHGAGGHNCSYLVDQQA